MVTAFQDAAGATPLDPDEAAGLIPTHITSQGDLNAWEQNNILQGREWSRRARQLKRELLEESFVRDLHQRMFGDTWKWAGTFRSSDKNIGVPWECIAVQLRNLLDDTRYQRDHKVYEADLDSIGDMRDEYLEALRAADAGSFQPLIAFARG